MLLADGEPERSRDHQRARGCALLIRGPETIGRVHDPQAPSMTREEMASEMPLESHTAPHRLGTSNEMRRIIVASSIGTALEWFDFVAYAMFAPIIAQTFFPTGNELSSLLATFGAFTAGFVMRPLGALLLGHYADSSGRKAALSASILLMAVGTGLMAIIPGYSRIGIAAPLLITCARLIQGLSAGGEVGCAFRSWLSTRPLVYADISRRGSRQVSAFFTSSRAPLDSP